MIHSERLNGLEITLVAHIYKIADRVKRELNLEMIVVSGYRDPATQAKLYAQGRTAPGAIVTNAQPGHSPHEFHCAADIWVMDHEGKKIDWNNTEYLQIAKEESTSNPNITWGGNFHSIKDNPHWEYSHWTEVKSGTRKIIPNQV